MIVRKSEHKKKRALFALGAIVLIGGVALVLTLMHKPKSKEVLNIGQQSGGQQQCEQKEDANYSELRKLFEKEEATLSKVVDGFDRAGVMKADITTSLYLSKDCKGHLKEIAPKSDDERKKAIPHELFNRVKNDIELGEALDIVEQNYNIREIHYNAESHELSFFNNAEETPYITDNDNLGTAFIYCKEKGLESKGYKPIKENWYMQILRKDEQETEAPKDSQKEEEENYSKLKEIFTKNETNLSDLVKGFERLGVLKEGSSVTIYLDGKADGKGELKWNGSGNQPNDEHYCSQETFNLIKHDREVCDVIFKLNTGSDIVQIFNDTNNHQVRFIVNLDKTPFIKGESLGAEFVYSKEKDLEAKGYKQIKENWYMQIPKSEEKDATKE